jgi:hypothetical protein
MRRRRNPYAQTHPADWADWSARERGAWHRRNWVKAVGDEPRSWHERVQARKRRMLARRERERGAYRSNPGRRGRRNPRWVFKDKHELHGRARRRSRYQQWRKLLRMNPKRDGTPTRGERRASKYKDHLRSIRERGQKAGQELRRLLGRSTTPVLTAEKTETQLAHPPHYAADMSTDQRYAQEQIGRLDAILADLREQMRALPDDDASEELAEGLSAEIAKVAGQRKALMDTSGLQPARNPGRPSHSRRRRNQVRWNPAAKVAYRRALLHYGQAIRRLC